MKKLFVVLFIFIVIPCIVHAQDVKDSAKYHSVALKGGYHFYPHDTFYDDYDMDDSAFNGGAFEMEYEYRVRSELGIVVPFGGNLGSYSFSKPDKKGDLKIKNYHIAPAAKYYFPAFKEIFTPYLGGGIGWYYAKGEWNIRKSATGNAYITDNSSESKSTLGFQFLGGLEVKWVKQQKKQLLKTYNIPVSIIFEGNYAWANQDNMDTKLAESINYSTVHDLKAGGFTLLMGIKFYF